MKNPKIAFISSLLLPGLGQLYLNEKPKALSLLCITAGMAFSAMVSRSGVFFFLLAPIYLFIAVPAALDAYQTASGRPRTFKGDSVPYVIILLCVVGPFALPLLWQSPRFSKTVKVLLTIFVTAVMVAAILVTLMLGSYFDELIRQNAATIPI